MRKVGLGKTGDTDPTGRGRLKGVSKAILMYGLEMLVLLSSIEIKLEGTHTGLFRYIMDKQEHRLEDGTWETPGLEVVQEAAGTQS